MRRNSKLFPSLNVVNGKTLPYASKGIIKHYHYFSDPKLGFGYCCNYNNSIQLPCSHNNIISFLIF